MEWSDSGARADPIEEREIQVIARQKSSRIMLQLLQKFVDERNGEVIEVDSDHEDEDDSDDERQRWLLPS